MCKCIICNREIKDTDDYELHGYDGDDNSLVYIEFSLKDMVVPIREEN